MHSAGDLRWSFLDSTSISRIAVGFLLITLHLVQTLKKKDSIIEGFCHSYKNMVHSGSGVPYMSLLDSPPKKERIKKKLSTVLLSLFIILPLQINNVLCYFYTACSIWDQGTPYARVQVSPGRQDPPFDLPISWRQR